MEIESLKSEILEEINNISHIKDLELIKSKYLGKNSKLAEFYQNMKNLQGEDKKNLGFILNNFKQETEKLINEKFELLRIENLNNQLLLDEIDITLPARPRQTGSIHPLSKALQEITDIWRKFGFKVEIGPEIETDYYNFTALNIPDHHPARQMHDTFYMLNNKLLRTHTSNVQIRIMENNKPPFKLIAPGRVYRSDDDATHTPMFHQIEGLYIDEKISFADLKTYLLEFLRLFFESPNLEIRLRPSYFPFTEPSAEVDIGYRKNGDKLELIGKDNWLEVMGCGMVHPKVLDNLNIDSNHWQGFAFGMGVERLAMLKYGINDLRKFFSGDLRFQYEYGFYPYL